jgi:hypothetical protein
MKNIPLTLLFILFSIFAQAQERSNIAVSYGFGSGSIASLGKSGSPYSYKQKSLNIFGLNYWHQIGKNLYFETGMQLIRFDYTMTSFLPNYFPIYGTTNIISLPLKLRFEAGNHIFFNGGLTADLSKHSDINGIGAGIGIGSQFKLFKQISFYINPQANIHGAITNGQYFAESNITFGASYRIR